jgi:hypothetical protein
MDERRTTAAASGKGSGGGCLRRLSYRRRTVSEAEEQYQSWNESMYMVNVSISHATVANDFLAPWGKL